MMRKYLQGLVLVVTAVLVCFAPTAFAITPDGVDTLAKDQWLYDPSTECADPAAAGTGGTNLVGGDNIEQAYNYFVSKGLTGPQSAGIVGNLMQESGVNPSSNNTGAKASSPSPSSIIPGVTWNGGGIAQWEGGRWTGQSGFLNFVAGKGAFAGKPQGDGKNWKVLSIQLDYMWWELNNSERSALTAVKTGTSAEDSAIKFEQTYERAGDPRMSNRIKNANQVLSKYGGNAATAATNTQIAAAAGCTAGTATVDPGTFTIYNQCDKEWGSKSYGPSTICESGCGPSAMAMIITALTGKRVTPADTSAYAGSHGMYIPGVGSSWDIPKVLAPNWGLKATFIGKNVAKINAAIQGGGYVIMSGRGALPYSSGGHYIAIRGITSSGKWLIGDSGHKNTSSQEWDPNGILVNTNDGSVYAVTK
ncbi:MAG TPA: phage tail tip lysozyme [Patescibacteria group bacterium]|nr:phage tail tip lysozyme [Patescibacteria group bacterium]